MECMSIDIFKEPAADVAEHDDDLGEVAAASQNDIGEFNEDGVAQPALVPEGTKVKFVGVQYNDTESVYKLGDEVEFTVKGRIVGESEDIMNDGHHRKTLKVNITSVVPAGEGE